MLGDCRYLTLEAKYLDRAVSFYEAFLDLQVRSESTSEVTLAVGDTDLILREPGPVPRGGLHTHYAFAIPDEEYDAWHDRLAESFDLVEHTFGDARSLYFYDPDGNCVELGQRDIDGTGLCDIFEIVLEVEEIDRAIAFYEALGFDVVDRGDGRTRVRLSTGHLDLELWAPQRGLADARGGVHVDVGVAAADPIAVAEAVRDDALAVEALDAPDDGVQIRDPDGHYITLIQS